MGKETLYQTGRAVARLLARPNIEGAENIPRHGPRLIIFNHPPEKSRLFYLGLVAAIPSRFSVLTKSLTRASYPNLISRIDIGLIGLSGIVDLITLEGPSGYRTVLKALSLGETIAISPEGDVNNNGQGLLQAKPGIAALAEKSQAPMVPMAITGNCRHLSVTVGLSFSFSEIKTPQSGDRHKYIQSQADEIMCRLVVLLPPEKRGFYASMC